MNLHEAIFYHEFAIKTADSGLQLEDGLVGGHTQINNSIVETNLLLDDSSLIFLLTLLLLFVIGTSFLGGLIKHETARILNLEGQYRSGLVDDPELLYGELDLLRAGLNGLFRHSNLGLDLDDGLLGRLRCEINHTLGYNFVNSKHGLNSGILLSDDDENQLALASGVVQSTAHNNLLTIKRGINILHFGESLGESELGVTLRSVQFSLAEEVSGRVVRILLCLVLGGSFSLLGCETCLLFGLTIITSRLSAGNLRQVTELKFFLSEYVLVRLLKVQPVSVLHSHRVSAQTAVKVDAGLAAEATIDPRRHVKHATEGRHGAWQTASSREDFLRGRKANALAVDELLKLLRAEFLGSAQDGEIERCVLKHELFSGVLENDGLGSAVEADVANLGGLLRGKHRSVLAHVKLDACIGKSRLDFVESGWVFRGLNPRLFVSHLVI